MSAEPLRIFVGWDARESIAYHVLCHSIISRASGPVTISPLQQGMLREMGCYWRERNPLESTAFAFTRFLVPYLSGYYGKAIFMDCDFLCRTDLYASVNTEVIKAEMAAMGRGAWPAVLCCQHDYTPGQSTKFLGNVQTAYPKKNWSSFMVFNNDRCRALTPEYVNSATGLELHRFLWLKDEEVAALPLDFNHLVGEYAPNPEARLLHWTTGGPWLPEYRDADHADMWFAERDAMLGLPAPVAAA